jgi:DNA polymerase-3 subunit delta'
MRFRDVRGHDAVVSRLRTSVGSRPASAYLLHGPAGIGKRRVADALAARLLCDAPEGEDTCATCAQCTRVRAGTHPDLNVVTRDEDRRDIRIEQIRELTRGLTLRPMMARRRVALIDGAHELNEAAQNAILKTLEEPPGDTVIVLVATGLARLLPTVRSRCQQIRLDPLPTAVVAEALEAAGHDAETARRLAARAGGSIGRAVVLADDALEAVRSRTIDVLAALPDVPAVDLSAYAAELARGAVDAGLETAVSWHHDLLRCSLGADDQGLANVDFEARIRAAAERLDPATALRQLEVVCDTVTAIGRNANKTLAIEVMLLDLRRLARRPAA